MRRLLVTIVVVLVGLAVADVCAKTVAGGYDLEKIAAATAERLTKAGIVTSADALVVGGTVASASNDPLVRGADVVAFYDRLGTILVERKTATPAEIDAMRTTAGASGGIKIGGLNPVILAASYLDLLARKGLISLPDAQKILDISKR